MRKLSIAQSFSGLCICLIAVLSLVACSEEGEQGANDSDKVTTSSKPAKPAYNAPTMDDVRSVMMHEHTLYSNLAKIKDTDTIFVSSPLPKELSPLANQIFTVDLTKIGADHTYRIDLRECKQAEGKDGYLCEFDRHISIVPNEEMRDMSRKLNHQVSRNPLYAVLLAPLLSYFKNMEGDGERYCTIHREHFVQTSSGWQSPTRHAYYQALSEYDRQAALYSEAESRCSTFESTKTINRSYCAVGGGGYEILTNGRPTPPQQPECEWQPGPAKAVTASAAPSFKQGSSTSDSSSRAVTSSQPTPRQMAVQPPPPEDPYKDAPRLPLAHTRYYAVAYAKLTGQDDDAFYEGLIKTLNKGQAPGYIAETIKTELEALAPLRRNFSPGQKVWVKGKVELRRQYDETSGTLPVSQLGFGPQYTGTRCAYNKMIYQKLEKQVDSIALNREQANLLLNKNWYYNGSFNARFLMSAVATGKAPYNLNPRPVGALKFRIHKIELVPVNIDVDVDDPEVVLASYEPDTSALPPVVLAKKKAPVKATIDESDFDIRGLRLGMPLAEAEKLVRKAMDVGAYLVTNPVTTRPGAYTSVRVFVARDKKEYIVLYGPYQDGDTLSGVLRYQYLAEGVTSEAISTQLLEKYGKAKQVQTSGDISGSIRWGSTADTTDCQSGQSGFGVKLPSVKMVENHTGEHEYRVYNSLGRIGSISIFNFQEKDAAKWTECGSVLETEWSLSDPPWLRQGLVNHGHYFKRLIQAKKGSNAKPGKLEL